MFGFDIGTCCEGNGTEELAPKFGNVDGALYPSFNDGRNKLFPD